MAGCHVLPAGRLEAVALAQDRDQRLRLHRADPRQAKQPALQVAAVGRLGPDPRRVAVVLARDRRSQRGHAAGHGARKAVDRGRLAEVLGELRRVGRGDPGSVEVAEPALQLEGPREGLLDGDLLVEAEADEQGQRVAGDEAIRIVVAGERQPLGGGGGGAHGPHGTSRRPFIAP
jgi:hypothetical protein